MVRERYKVRDKLASQRDAFFQTVWSEKRRNFYGKMNEKVRRTAEISLISSTIYLSGIEAALVLLYADH